MIRLSPIGSIWAVLVFAIHVWVVGVGAQSQQCDSNSGVCVAFSIPLTTAAAATDNADILATVQAPGNLGWVGFGFGKQMAGSLIFVLWPNNDDVVVSSRYASGEQQPSVYTGPSVTVISKNITSSQFTAQLQLKNVTAWRNSGSLNVNSNDAGVIWAFGTSAPSDPSNPSSNFQQHRTMGTFSIDMKSAQFVQTSASASLGNQPSATQSITGPTITGGAINPVDDGTGLTYRDKIIIAHGVMMGLSFVILFPLGAIIIRFLAAYLPAPTRIHYITQIISLLVVLAAMGLGIYLSVGDQFNHFHQIFGIVIIGLIFLQLLLGYYHHRRFLIDKPSYRRWFTHAHLWLGRLVILLGLANGGCGLILAPVATKYAIIWWAVCGGLAVIYGVISIVMGFSSRATRTKRTGEPYGNANGPGYSPNRYKQAESYEMTRSSERL